MVLTPTFSKPEGPPPNLRTVIYGVVWQQLFYAKCFIEHLSNMTAYCDRFGVLFVGLAQSWNN